MKRCTHGSETWTRLHMLMGLLEPQSRRLMELWLAGRNREEIATELQLGDEAISALFDTAFRQLRSLVDQPSEKMP